MNRSTRLFAFALVPLLLLAASGASGQQRTDPLRVLLPIILQRPVEGAHGSRWTTDLVLFNSGDRAYDVWVWSGCTIPPCGPTSLPPGLTFFPVRSYLGVAGIPAHLLGVEKAGVESIRIELRVRDLSRELESFGTEVPIVPESEAKVGPIHLLDVPFGGSFRSMLRVYDFDSGPERRVRLRFFAIDARVVLDPREILPDRLIAERVETFRVHPPGVVHPGYIEIPLGTIPELAGVGRLRIEIEPVTPGLRFWAMASITNNVTQEVTLVTPR